MKFKLIQLCVKDRVLIWDYSSKENLLKSGRSQKLGNMGAWIVFAYLILNTLVNFASDVTVETLVFGPLTIVMAFCALRFAFENFTTGQF